MSQFNAQLKRGALVNLIGIAAKLIYPLFFVVLTWLFGPEVVGLYFLVVFIAEVAVSAVSSGFNDATVIYASHAVDDESGAEIKVSARAYRVLANGLVLTLGFSILLVIAFMLGADVLVDRIYDGRDGLASALKLAVCALPFVAIGQIAIGGTKALMKMEYDAAINGFLKPFSLLGFALLAWWLNAGVMGVVAAYVGTQVVMALTGLWALFRYYELGSLLQAIRRFELDSEVLRFAIPQNLNMTFNRYLSRLDVIMLGAFGFGDAMLAFYASGALITSNIREIKLIFSQAFAPIAARHHAAGERAIFEAVLSRVCRWTTSLAVPVILMVFILREDLLKLVDSSYTHDSLFMAVLLLPPLFSCAFGLAGNSIVYCGHAKWNLFNSLTVAALNTLFNWILIPRYGLMGAALATACAAGLITILQLIELWWIEGIKVRLSAVWKPHLALGVLVLGLLFFGDPAQIQGLENRLFTAAGVLLSYGVILIALKHEEWLVFRNRKQR